MLTDPTSDYSTDLILPNFLDPWYHPLVSHQCCFYPGSDYANPLAHPLLMFVLVPSFKLVTESVNEGLDDMRLQGGASG